MGVIAAITGAVGGVVAGELLGRTKIRSWVLLVGLIVAGLLGWQFARMAISGSLIPGIFGPVGALSVSVVLRFGVVAITITALLRTIAIRKAPLIVLELFAVVSALVVLFAAHRNGVLIRPLWLSDWATRHGWQPIHVFVVIGAAIVVVLALLLVAESKRRVGLFSLVSIFVVAFLLFIGLLVTGVLDPSENASAAAELGLIDESMGEEPDLDEGPESDWGGGEGGTPDVDEDAVGDGLGEDGELDGGDGGAGGDLTDGGEGGSGPERGELVPVEPPPIPTLDPAEEPPPPDLGPEWQALLIFGDDYVPPSQTYFLRQEIWSYFNGSRLVSTTRDDVDQDIILNFPTRLERADELAPSEIVFGLGDELPRWAADVEPDEEGNVVVATRDLIQTEVYTRANINFVNPFGLESPVLYEPIPNPSPEYFGRAYRTESLAQTLDYLQLVDFAAGSSDWSPQVLEYYLQIPEDPRYVELADQIIAEQDLERETTAPFLLALAVKLWLDEHLTYYIGERHSGVDDPTADFLFGNRTGYCVHFAHAATYLWRALGIPSRIGVGYAPSPDDQQGSELLVAGSDAHAWPEMYLDGIGWVILDISAYNVIQPPGGQPPPPDPDLLDQLVDAARQQTDADSGMWVDAEFIINGEPVDLSEVEVTYRDLGSDCPLPHSGSIVIADPAGNPLVYTFDRTSPLDGLVEISGDTGTQGRIDLCQSF